MFMCKISADLPPTPYLCPHTLILSTSSMHCKCSYIIYAHVQKHSCCYTMLELSGLTPHPLILHVCHKGGNWGRATREAFRCYWAAVGGSQFTLFQPVSITQPSKHLRLLQRRRSLSCFFHCILLLYMFITYYLISITLLAKPMCGCSLNVIVCCLNNIHIIITISVNRYF